MDKIFVLDNFNIVLDKIYFVRADGQGISFETSWKGQWPLLKGELIFHYWLQVESYDFNVQFWKSS